AQAGDAGSGNQDFHVCLPLLLLGIITMEKRFNPIRINPSQGASMSVRPSSRPKIPRPQRRGETVAEGGLAPGVDYGPLTDLLGYCLRRAQIRIYQDFLDAMDPWSITPPRFSAMTLIRHNTGMKLTELARAMGIARSGAVEVVDSLEKLGYVRRASS